jgi:hypothetical protein
MSCSPSSWAGGGCQQPVPAPAASPHAACPCTAVASINTSMPNQVYATAAHHPAGQVVAVCSQCLLQQLHHMRHAHVRQSQASTQACQTKYMQLLLTIQLGRWWLSAASACSSSFTTCGMPMYGSRKHQHKHAKPSICNCCSPSSWAGGGCLQPVPAPAASLPAATGPQQPQAQPTPAATQRTAQQQRHSMLNRGIG